MEKSEGKPLLGITPNGWLQITVVSAAILFAFFLALGSGYGETAYTGEPASAEFASCITEKGAVFYGAEWCSHCREQKAIFGETFEKINYVDCEKSPALCQLAEITAYPTWIINGEKHLGAKSPQALAALTGCGAGA